ncbi:MAG: hypothetical protein E5X60_37605, partial [Mesorhizobium sp.]
ALAGTNHGDRLCMRRLKDHSSRRSWHVKRCSRSCRRATLNSVAAKRPRCCTISTCSGRARQPSSLPKRFLQ